MRSHVSSAELGSAKLDQSEPDHVRPNMTCITKSSCVDKTGQSKTKFNEHNFLFLDSV